MPSPTLNPGVLTDELRVLPEHTGVTDAHATFTSVHAALEKLEAAEDAIRQDRTLSKPAQRAASNELRGKVADRLSKQLDDGYNRALDQSRAADDAAAAALTPDERTVDAQEIRRHVASLAGNERGRFILGRAEAGDRETLNAVFDAPAYLAGLSDDDHVALRDEALRVVAPAVYTERETLRRVVARFEGAGKAFTAEYLRSAGAIEANEAQRRADAISAALSDGEAA